MSPERWRIVDSIVQRALDAAPDERSAFLDRACGADAALRREVDSFLAAMADDEFLERWAGVLPPPVLRRDPPSLERVTAALEERFVVERELGRGGMATVYLARDLRQRRPVAVKVLDAELAMLLGAERFLREIELTASLQHPHILPLFDSGSADGLLYYVMPHVTGESLRARLVRERQLSVSDAARIAIEVASALEYAHKRGVVHRDVKPENILLADDGSALVADFGIALAVSHAADERITATGLSVGTPQYMAPEQARAERDLDARVDVYALGCVLYEMLAGEPPFTGPTAHAITTRVLTEAPRPLTAERPTVPPQMDAAVRIALAKLPADRFPSARAFAEALEVARTTAAPHPSPVVSAPSRRSRVIVGAVAALSILAVAAAVWGWLRAGASTPERPPSHLAIVAPDLAGLASVAHQRLIALAPDGRAVVYVARRGTAPHQLAVRPLDGLAPTVLAMREGLGNPVVTPDGRTILASVAGVKSVYRYRVDGGNEESLMGTALGTNAGWDADGAIWSAATPDGRGLARFDSSGEMTRPFATSDGDLHLHQVLPDGRHALVTRSATAWPNGPVLLFDLRTGEHKPLLNRVVIAVRYTAGYLVYVRPPDRMLLAAPFDPERHTIGSPVELATDVGVTATGAAQLAVAPNGTVAYVAFEPFSVVLVDRDGAIRVASRERRRYHGPKLSPDGRRIAVSVGTVDGGDVWILSLDDSTLTRATFDGTSIDGVWNRDPRQLTYLSGRNRQLGIYRKRLDAAAPVESLYTGRGLDHYTGTWLRDGSGLVTIMNGMRPGSGMDIALLPNGGRGPAEPLLATPFAEAYPALSPDDRWLAFVSDQSGRQEVYARPLRADGEEVRISSGGGTEPVWSPNGREVFYRSTHGADPRMMSATVRVDGARLIVTGRRALFSVSELLGSGPHANYDVTPDGRTFVMLRYTPPTHIMVIQNLPALVERMKQR